VQPMEVASLPEVFVTSVDGEGYAGLSEFSESK
jgi:hypothetical protein